MMRTLIATLFLFAAAPVLAAPVVSFDANASEWSSLTAPVPGVILPIGGSGQTNGNFTTVSDTALPGAQIGLRINERFSPVPLPNVDADYFAQPGESSPGLPTWNYDIHIDLRGTGLSFDDFDISFTTSVANHSAPNLQAALEAALVTPAGALDGVELYQSSLNPGFFGSGIDPFAPGVETFALTLTPKSNVDAPVLGVDVTATIVPEPAAALIGCLALVGVAMTRRNG